MSLLSSLGGWTIASAMYRCSFILLILILIFDLLLYSLKIGTTLLYRYPYRYRYYHQDANALLSTSFSLGLCGWMVCLLPANLSILSIRLSPGRMESDREMNGADKQYDLWRLGWMFQYSRIRLYMSFGRISIFSSCTSIPCPPSHFPSPTHWFCLIFPSYLSQA